MMGHLKGFRQIFSFTFARHALTKRFITATVIGVILCLAGPALAMGLVEALDGGAGEATHIPEISQVFVVRHDDGAELRLDILNSLGAPGLSAVTYTDCGSDLDRAKTLADATPKSLILVIDAQDSAYTLSVLTPEATALTRADTSAFRTFLETGFRLVLADSSGIPGESLAALFTPVHTVTHTAATDTEAATSSLREALSYILPYFFVMMLYFLVLFYGTGVANSVMMEKTSRLMDNFLIYVKPGAMVVGKTLAIALAAALQFFLWMAALFGGFALGALLVKAINPATDMALVLLFDNLDAFSGLLTLGGAVMALLIVAAGFLLYCSLAAVGGALAGKPEELASTNALFTLTLVVSFFAVLYGGLQSSGGPLNWIPFTATLMAPGRVMLGEISVLAGLGVFALTLALAVLIMLLAGRLYRVMALRKGTPPKLSQIPQILWGK